MTLCPQCSRPVLVLVGDDERPCAVCEEAATKLAREREATRERVRRFRAKQQFVCAVLGNAFGGVAVTPDVVRTARRVVANRERQSRFRAKQRTAERERRNAHEGRSVTRTVIRRHSRGADLTGFVDRTPEREIGALPPPAPGDRECACGRALNLGRYKTEGDTCGTCKRERRIAEKERLPWYVTPEELARQLEDDTPLPEDDDE